jgi:hypothetical protein
MTGHVDVRSRRQHQLGLAQTNTVRGVQPGPWFRRECLRIDDAVLAALAPLQRRYRHHAAVHARRATQPFTWTSGRGQPQHAEAGDWHLRDDHHEWSVDGRLFARRYRWIGGDRYQRRRPVNAARIWQPFIVLTREGDAEGAAGDWLCIGDRGDAWAVTWPAFLDHHSPADVLHGGQLITWAEDTATSMLASLPRRLAHTRAVASTANSIARLLGWTDDERRLLVAAAWCHDLGYSPILARATGFHPLDGARAIAGIVPTDVAALVAHHTGADHEAGHRGLAGALRAIPRGQPLLADALTFADLTCGPEGARIAVAQRFADIKRRYDSGHPVSLSIDEAKPELLASINRITRLVGQTRQEPLRLAPARPVEESVSGPPQSWVPAHRRVATADRGGSHD